MIDQIRKGDTVILPLSLKDELLKEISKNKKLLNVKLMTKEEFINKYYGSYKNESLYFLMKKFNLNYDIAKKYLKNIFINTDAIKPYYDALNENNLLLKNNLFKENLNKITVIGYPDLDPYLLNELEKYNLKIIQNKKENLSPKINEFQSQTDELTFIASDIIKKLETVEINDIYIVGVTNEYKPELIRIFKIFNIPLNLKESSKIYSTKTAKIFLNNLKTQDIETSLENTPNNDVKNQIIDIINKYSLNSNDETTLELIKNEMKNTSLKTKDKTNAVKVIDINQIIDKSKHYYIIGFNQGIIPKLYKDDDIISDEEKYNVGMLTSIAHNKLEKNQITNVITSFPNLTLSYKLKDSFNTYFPSALINELNLKVDKKHDINLDVSNSFNKTLLGIYLDNYINYNDKNENLDLLWSNYPDINYLTYDNKYKAVDKNLLKEYMDHKLKLSYTSLNNYMLCPFKFYMGNILYLDPFEDTFASLIGQLFHYCLSKMYEKDFDLRKTYEEFLKDKTLSNKEKFFLKKLYSILKEDIEIIKDQESHSKYIKHLTEKEIIIKKEGETEITFKGIIDKISYLEENNIKKAIIIDYKTGVITSTLDNINHGLNMQLPIYLYLLKNTKENYLITGLYLQKILNGQTVDSEDQSKENKNNLKLTGYTIDDKDLIEEIDDTYQDSQMIKGMKTTKTGFYVYSKVISEEKLNKLYQITEDNINKTIKNILNGNFDIIPKRLDDKNISCTFCPFKDLCFMKEDDVKVLKNTKFKDIIED